MRWMLLPGCCLSSLAGLLPCLPGRKGYVCKDEREGRASYKQRGGNGPQKDVNMRVGPVLDAGRGCAGA